MIAAVLTKTFGGPIAEYNSFLIASGSSLVGCILGTYLTPATDGAVLSKFYTIFDCLKLYFPIIFDNRSSLTFENL